MREGLDLDAIEKRLEDRLAAITASQDENKGGNTVVLDQTSVGRLSRMDAMQQQAMAQAASRLADLERQRIQSALSRLRSGEYGYCVSCGEEIFEKRLQNDPSVPTCIACAREAERK